MTFGRQLINSSCVTVETREEERERERESERTSENE